MKKYLKSLIVASHALVLWILCGATIGIGSALFGMQAALIIHLIMAPVFAAGIAFFYFNRFNHTTPLVTAVIFLLFIFLMDFFVVAMLVERNFDMFKSVIGTWLPFALIFLSTFLTGFLVYRYKK